MSLGTNAELDFMLQDSGVPVSYGNAPVQNIYAQLDEDFVEADGGESGFEFKGPATTIVIRDGALAGLKQDQPITVNGVVYKVRDIGHRDSEGKRRIQIVK